MRPWTRFEANQVSTTTSDSRTQYVKTTAAVSSRPMATVYTNGLNAEPG